jgi:hypothetical protein
MFLLLWELRSSGLTRRFGKFRQAICALINSIWRGRFFGQLYKFRFLNGASKSSWLKGLVLHFGATSHLYMFVLGAMTFVRHEVW